MVFASLQHLGGIVAIVTITLEDNELNGTVKVVANPTFETMAMKVDSGNLPTAAETYALFVLRKIREASRSLDRREQRLEFDNL